MNQESRKKQVADELWKLRAENERLREILQEVLEHLEWLTIALREQASGNGDKICMWNSSGTVSVINEAREALKSIEEVTR